MQVSRLKKRILEGRLKRAGLGFADSKLRTDFELIGAIHFQVGLAALRKQSPHCIQRQLRGVAIPTEMSEHNALDFSRQQFLDHACRSCVRQMTVPRLDSLFHWPGPMRVLLQQFLIMIGLDNEWQAFAKG